MADRQTAMSLALVNLLVVPMKPPVIHREPRTLWPFRTASGLLFAATMTAVAMALYGIPRAFGWPECGLRRWFEIPCPFCGGTRSLAALGQGNFAAAAALNPLVFLAALAVCAAFVLAVFGWKPGSWIRSFEERSGLRWIWLFVMLLLVNWLYVLFAKTGWT